MRREIAREAEAAQGELFGASDAVLPAQHSQALQELARRLPPHTYFGTSSWSFPGWARLVYDREYSEAQLARNGLTAYAQHPLLNAVGLDRSFYAPVPPLQLQRYAEAVPADFRFVVKAYSGLTTVPEAPRPAHLATAPNVYLDAEFATRHVIEPTLAAFGERLGAIVFQFSPQSGARTRRPQQFHAELHRFLSALPQGPLYSVELRNREFLGAEYEALLRDAGAVHCANAHPRMPAVDEQVALRHDRPLVVRWMLHPSQAYEEARELYAPFNTLVDPDLTNRRRIGGMLLAATRSGQPAMIIANNKAEGSAPLSLTELARWLAAQPIASAAPER
jgi:uncharacterized protein YecE (DUF72 family)